MLHQITDNSCQAEGVYFKFLKKLKLRKMVISQHPLTEEKNKQCIFFKICDKRFRDGLSDIALSYYVGNCDIHAEQKISATN
jgi:hypothetical protein